MAGRVFPAYDSMNDQPSGLITLEDHQRQFVWSTEHETMLFGGVGNGKSYSGIARCLMLCDDYPGNRLLIGRLTYDQLRDTTEKEFLEIVKRRNLVNGLPSLEPGPYVKKFTQRPDTLVLQSGSEVLFRFLDDEDSAVNHNLGGFWIDQIEQVREGVYDHLLDRLRLWGNEDDPMSAGNIFFKKYGYRPRHWAMGTGNPAPTWVKRRFKRKLTADHKPLVNLLIEAPTGANRKHLPKDFEERLRAKHTDKWIQRLIEGSWEAFQGAVYEEFSEPLHVIDPFEVPINWVRTLGWDHGTTQSPTAVSFVATDEHGYSVLYREYYKLSAQIKEHADAIKAMCEGDSVQRGGEDGKGVVVIMDPQVKGDTDAEGRNFGQLYVELGIIPINATKHVEAGIGKLSLLFHPDKNRPFPSWHPRGEKRDKNGKLIKAAELGSPKLFLFSNCPVHIHQIQAYHYPDEKNNRSKGEEVNAKEVPVKFNDHTCDSLRYACFHIFSKAEPVQEAKPQDPYLASVLARLREQDEFDSQSYA